MAKKDKEGPYKEEGARLRQILNALRLSQDDFAKEYQVSNSTMSRLVKGEAKIPADLYVYLYQKHKVRLDYSILGEGRMILGESERQQNSIVEVKKIQTLLVINTNEFLALQRKFVKLYNKVQEMEQKELERGY